VESLLSIADQQDHGWSGWRPGAVVAYYSEPGQIIHHTVTATVSPGHACTQGGSYGVGSLSLEVTRTQ